MLLDHPFSTDSILFTVRTHQKWSEDYKGTMERLVSRARHQTARVQGRVFEASYVRVSAPLAPSGH
jgi:hypothetical protein